MERLTMLAALIGLLVPAASRAEDPAPLMLETKIALGTVGAASTTLPSTPFGSFCSWPTRQRQRGYRRPKERNVLHRIAGLDEPQGVAWHPATGTLYVPTPATDH